MKIKSEYILVACLLVCSCGENINKKNFSSNEKLIYGKAVQTDCLIGRPSEIVCVDSFLLFCDRYEGQAITILHTGDDKFVRRFLNEGQGPGEVIHPVTLSISERKKVNVFQMQKSNLYEYSLKDILESGHDATMNQYVFEDRPANIKRTANGFIGIGMYDNGRYRLYNETGKAINSIGQYPFGGENMNQQERFFLYQGALCVSPNGENFAMGSSYCDNMEFYRIEKDNAQLVKRYETYDVKGHFEQRIFLDNDCVMAYKGAYGTMRYCYMLYSGKTYGERHRRTTGGEDILVFDWEGTYIRRFKTDKTVFSFCIDDTDSIMFAITHDEEDGFGITRFDL